MIIKISDYQLVKLVPIKNGPFLNFRNEEFNVSIWEHITPKGYYFLSIDSEHVVEEDSFDECFRTLNQVYPKIRFILPSELKLTKSNSGKIIGWEWADRRWTEGLLDSYSISE